MGDSTIDSRAAMLQAARSLSATDEFERAQIPRHAVVPPLFFRRPVQDPLIVQSAPTPKCRNISRILLLRPRGTNANAPILATQSAEFFGRYTGVTTFRPFDQRLGSVVCSAHPLTI